jgi:hypothetical protein
MGLEKKIEDVVNLANRSSYTTDLDHVWLLNAEKQ